MNDNDSAVFIPDQQKLNLTPTDLFDKIINVKLTCVDLTSPSKPKEVFVIRSDYEMIYPDKGVPVDGTVIPSLKDKCLIRRCTMKPSIKVQCKMVSTNTGTTTQLYISNFVMLTKDGKHLRSFNSSQYTIETVEIVMGYWGQFRLGDKESDNVVPTYEEFFDIKARNGADKLTLTGALVVTTEKLPPDSVLCIKGFVADIYSSPITITQIGTAQKALTNPVASSGKGFDEICYDLLTRRYLNRHTFTDGKVKSNAMLSAMREMAISEIKTFDIGITYDKETGLMSKSDADKYGVKVYLSKEAKKIAIPKTVDSDGNSVDKKLYFESGWTMGQTMARIMSFLDGKIDYTFDRNGDIMIYTKDEVTDPKELYSAFETEGVYKQTVLSSKELYNSKLPAVYNITIDAVATIVCPFFTFLEPFQYVEFSSRYALTSMVSYFASYAPTVYRFYIINASISFATVDDVNEVQLTAVATKDEQTAQ